MQKKMELRKRAKKKLRLRIATQRDIDRALSHVNRKSFKPVTKLYHTIAQAKHEFTTQ